MEEITAMFDNLRKEFTTGLKVDIETLIKLHKEDDNDSRRKSVGTDTKAEQCGR